MTYITGFPPIANKNARILVLGSMPGQRSLQENEYYAHPRNCFWPIMCRLFKAEENLSYTKRKQLLIKHRIALWDVLKDCERKGSLDSDIDQSTIMPNDFNTFFKKHTNIDVVLFNGTKAEQLFKKKVLKTLDQKINLNYQRLPSTSPAHAAMTMENKLQEWKIIKTFM